MVHRRRAGDLGYDALLSAMADRGAGRRHRAALRAGEEGCEDAGLREEGEPDRVIKAGEAWFESGREPVYARASSTTPTAFIRCSILPREIRGQSSIMYVDPSDAGSKPRKYTVLVDEPIELPR